MFDPIIYSKILPVVELSTDFTAGATITGEDSKKLWAAFNKGLPTVIKFNNVTAVSASFQNASMIWSVVSSLGNPSVALFVSSNGGTVLQIVALLDGESDWVCNVV